MNKNILLIANKADQQIHDEFKKHLLNLNNSNPQFNIEIFSVLELIPGSNQKTDINLKIENADLIVLMISPDLINEKVDNKRELIKIFKTDKEKVAIITRPCIWEKISCLTNDHLIILPRDRIAISSYEKKDHIYKNITTKIDCLLHESIRKNENHFPGEIVCNKNYIITKNLEIIDDIINFIEANEKIRILKIAGAYLYGKGTISTMVKKRLTQKGNSIVTINLKQIRNNLNKNVNYILQEFCRCVSQKLNLEDNTQKIWLEHPDRIPELVCQLYFERFILLKHKQPIIIVIHRLDQIVCYPKTLERIINLINIFNDKGAMYNKWKSIKFLITYYIDDEFVFDQDSPQLKGKEIQLSDFSISDTLELSRTHGLELTIEEIESLLFYLSGVPFLIDKSLYEIKSRNIKVEEFISELQSENNSFLNFLNNLWNRIRIHPKNIKVLKDIIKQKDVKGSKETIFLLKLGIIERKSGNYIIKNKFYKDFFSKKIK